MANDLLRVYGTSKPANWTEGGERALMGQKQDENYDHLSNEELHRMLCEKLPEMTLFPVTDETRNTAIAMLKTLRKPTGGARTSSC